MSISCEKNDKFLFSDYLLIIIITKSYFFQICQLVYEKQLSCLNFVKEILLK